MEWVIWPAACQVLADPRRPGVVQQHVVGKDQHVVVPRSRVLRDDVVPAVGRLQVGGDLVHEQVDQDHRRDHLDEDVPPDVDLDLARLVDELAELLHFVEVGHRDALQEAYEHYYVKFKDVVWIDVRHPSDFAVGRVKGAINIPVYSLGRRLADS